MREAAGVEGVEVRIADSGPGIAPELREQIFNPFVTTKKTGVGLGLSIVSKIIDGHHGIDSRGKREPACGRKRTRSGCLLRDVLPRGECDHCASRSRPIW